MYICRLTTPLIKKKKETIREKVSLASQILDFTFHTSREPCWLYRVCCYTYVEDVTDLILTVFLTNKYHHTVDLGQNDIDLPDNVLTPPFIISAHHSQMNIS